MEEGRNERENGRRKRERERNLIKRDDNNYRSESTCISDALRGGRERETNASWSLLRSDLS